MSQADHEDTTDAPISEPVSIADVFCSSLATIERIGPCVRLTFTVPLTMAGSSSTERAIVARLILPADALPTMIYRLGAGSDRIDTAMRERRAAVVN